MYWFIWLLVIILAVIAVFELIMYYCFLGCFHRTGAKSAGIKIPEQYAPLIKRGTDLFDQAEKQDVFIRSFDGLKLHGVFIKGTRDNGVTEILFHGYRSSVYDFSGGFEFYKSLGINLLFVDQRAHGDSEGKYITFGINESRDALSWIDYVSENIGGEIYLGGISMGASTVMMAAGRDLPLNVKGIIADCGFTSTKDIICHVLKNKYRVPAFLIKPIVMNLALFARIFGKFDINEITAPDALNKCNVPVIITHGLEDRFVPPVMSEINAKNCASPHKLIKVPGARHGFAYVIQPDVCYGAILETFPSLTNGIQPVIPRV